MTEREKIISLARECGFGNADVCEGMFYPNFEAFYKAAQSEAYEKAAQVAESTVWKQHLKFNQGEPFKDHMHWEDIAAAIRKLKGQS